MNPFRDKTVVLGVTGSIAAYKAAALASELYQLGARVHVIMTAAATHFVSPLTFETLTHRPVTRDVLALNADSEIEHVALAKRADLVIVAPATANTLARLAHGLADDALSATILDTRAPILLAPAMETGMWENPATQANLAILQTRGMMIVEPREGMLASGARGKGRMAEPVEILAVARQILSRHGTLAGKRIVVTAGGTREPIDPVRVITNRSSGKMGYALAAEALTRGAAVTLITTREDGAAPPGANVIRVETTVEMLDAVLGSIRGCDALLMAAAPADYRPVQVQSQKIKKDEAERLSLELVRNPDILAQVALLRHERPAEAPRVVVGFAAETDELLVNARAKLERKHLDLIVANPVPQTFGSDIVKATLLFANGNEIELEPLSKEQLASLLFDRLEELLL